MTVRVPSAVVALHPRVGLSYGAAKALALAALDAAYFSALAPLCVNAKGTIDQSEMARRTGYARHHARDKLAEPAVAAACARAIRKATRQRKKAKR